MFKKEKGEAMKKIALATLIIGCVGYISIGLVINYKYNSWVVTLLGTILSFLCYKVALKIDSVVSMKRAFDEDQENKNVEHEALLADITVVPQNEDLRTAECINREISRGDF